MTSLTNELYAIFMCHLLSGSEAPVRYTEMLLDDVKKSPKGDGLHVLWMHIMPFLQEPVKEVFNYSQKMHISACEFVCRWFPDDRMPKILMKRWQEKWSIRTFTTAA